MKRMRKIGLVLAGGLMLALGGCHGAVILDRPYYTCAAPRRTVTYYHRPAVVHTTVYVRHSSGGHAYHGHR